MNETTIKFQPELVKRLNVAMADASVAVAEAAMSAVAQDKKVTVRVFAQALRTVAPMLGTATAVLSAAVKAAKMDNTTLDNVCQAMADAADKKRRDDARRAKEKRDEAPGKALQKALAEVEECKRAMRTPLEVARDNLATAEARVREAARMLREERAKLRAARAKLAELAKQAGQVELIVEPAKKPAEQAA